MWGPPVITWFVNPINYNYKYHKPVIGVINNQLSYPGGPTLYDSMSVCVCQSPTFQGEQEHSSTSLVVNMPVSADSKPAPMPIGIS